MGDKTRVIDSKGRVYIPTHLRSILYDREVKVYVQDGKIIIEPIKTMCPICGKFPVEEGNVMCKECNKRWGRKENNDTEKEEQH